MNYTTEKIEDINKFLSENFGIDTDSTQQMWRVVWSEDQFEPRLTEHTDSGMLLLRPEVRNLPKYKQWIHNKYILEHLVVIPDVSLREIPATKKSYEPVWVFEDARGNALPPKIEACKLIIKTVEEAMLTARTGKAFDMKAKLIKQQDESETTEKHLLNEKKRVDGYIEELFGEQSSLQGTTKTGESIIVPRTFERE
jgi:hypothetical protein